MIKVEKVSGQELTLEALTQRYKAAAKKSCGAVVEMADTIVTADQELKGADSAAFYEAIGLHPKGSTVRKFRQIGKASSRFKPFLDRLPSTWTTLYQLAQLEVDEFERLMASDAIHPLATWSELEEARGHERERRRSPILFVSI